MPPALASHPYLARKRVRPHELRINNDGRLIVPVFGLTGEISSLQFIAEDGGKDFLPGGTMLGGHCIVGERQLQPDGIIGISEGWATGASIHEAKGAPVVVAFNAGNLPRVAEMARRKYPDATIVIFADNDCWKPGIGNVGLQKATEAARGIRAILAVPDTAGIEGHPTDFNDVHVACGLDEVRRQIDAALQREPEPAESRNEPQENAPVSGKWRQIGPRYPAPAGTVSDARAKVRASVRDWAAGVAPYHIARAEHEERQTEGAISGIAPPPTEFIRVDTGLGKSESALAAAVDLTIEAKAAGRTVIFSAPTHALSAELQARFKAIAASHGFTAEVYRGWSAADPEAPGEHMCRRHDESDEVGIALGNKRNLCRTPGEVCSFKDVCGTKRLERAQADLRIVPHHSLLYVKPAMIPAPYALIIDESVQGAAMKGFGGPLRLSFDEVRRRRDVCWLRSGVQAHEAEAPSAQ